MPHSRLFERAGKWVDHHRETMALVLSAVGLLYFVDMASWITNEKLSAWWRGAGLAGVAGTVVLAWFGAKSPARLAAENESLRLRVSEMEAVIRGFGSDYFDIWDKRLQVLAEEMECTAADRISVYRHENNSFTMVGRFAHQPEYDKPGRSVYPVDQGIIGTAWKASDGKCVVQDLPDPRIDFEQYSDVNLRDWGVPKKVTQRMAMRARSIAAFCMNDERNTTRHAIIVFESTDAHRFDVEKIESRVRGVIGKDLIHLLEIIRNREPSLGYAKDKGF